MRIVLLVLACTSTALAAGPSVVARAGAPWPRPITDAASFDTASRAELLVLAAAIAANPIGARTPEALGIKKLDRDSLQKWSAIHDASVLRAFADASRTCTDGAPGCGFQGTTVAALAAHAAKVLPALPPEFRAWSESSRNFWGLWLAEQHRLGALFPHPTSEALLLATNEISGDELPDRTFRVTLDDGPTPAKGDTDRYVAMLRSEGVQATFYALGSALDKRVTATGAPAATELYRGQCLASHGWTHVSHQSSKDWQTSIDRTAALIRSVVPSQEPVDFRPPYGQRTEALSAHLAASHAQLVLWNVDSQDWHSGIDATELAARVQKLMLVKRRGILLFHDVHPKALVALPKIFAFAKAAGITWAPCR